MHEESKGTKLRNIIIYHSNDLATWGLQNVITITPRTI